MTISIAEPERRRSPRKPAVIESWISSPTAKNPKDRITVTSIDLSKHGVAFDCAKNLPIHAFFKIEIGYGEQHIICEVRTISSRQVSPGKWHIGAEFH